MAKKRKTSFWIKLLIILNIVSALLLIGSYATVYVSPATYWYLGVLGLGYPILFAVNLFFVLLWLFIRKRLVFISLIVLALGWNKVFIHYQYTRENSNYKPNFNVLSYNVRLFDLYDSKDLKANIRSKDHIIDVISKQEAQVICLQEYYADIKKKYSTTDTLLILLKDYNVHVEYPVVKSNRHCFGIATFTSYHIVNRGKITFSNNPNNFCLFTDVLINNDTMRIYNVHFESIRFGKEDYLFSNEDIPGKYENKLIKDVSLTMLKKLRRAFQKRAAQADIVAKHIGQCHYPVILCGDFNDTPSSYTYHTISSRLKDAFVEKGNGFGFTYIKRFPSYRIDYIFHDRTFKVNEFKTLHENYSDHYPIYCNFAINQ